MEETVLTTPLVATSVLLVLGEYLNHIAFIKDKIHSDIREQARIGADVIAASSQYAVAAFESISDEDSPSIPLPVFALSRSSIYGLIYLDNVDLVRKGEKLPSPGAYIQKTMDRWNRGNTFGLGIFDEKTDYHKIWSELSEFVHIIPAIKVEGGAFYGSRVQFKFGRDLSKPTSHAGLPESFNAKAQECIEWQARLTMATISDFRRKHRRLFEFSSTKVQSHLENVVFPDCIATISSIECPPELQNSITRLAKQLFASTV
jgi:hypothetical protein